MFDRSIFGRTRVRRELPPGPFADRYQIESVALPRHAGVTLEGWRAQPIVAPDQTRVLLYFGGRNEDVWWAPKMASYLPGWTIYAFNYRGMGASAGKPDEKTAKADALAAYALVRQHHAQGRGTLVEVAIMGRSLGTAVAVWLAHQVAPQTLVLLSPFCSLRTILAARWWTRPLGWLSWNRFHTLSLAPAVTARTLILLAERDARIARSDSLRLARALGTSPELEVIAGTTHRSLPRHVQTQRRLAQFLLAQDSATGPRSVDSPARCSPAFVTPGS